MTDREIINYIPLLIYGLEYNPALGPQTGRIAYCNKSTQEFTNYTEAEIVSKGFDFFREIVHPDDLYKTTHTISILINSDINEHCEIYRVRDRKHNKYTFLKVFCRIIRPFHENEIIQFVVTTFKANSEEIEKLHPQIKDIPNIEFYSQN